MIHFGLWHGYVLGTAGSHQLGLSAGLAFIVWTVSGPGFHMYSVCIQGNYLVGDGRELELGWTS